MVWMTGILQECHRDGSGRESIFYYTRKLEQGDSVDIFTGVTVPSQWDESYQDKKLGITIVADAVQAANFAPDFRAMSPWGNQKILRCIHDTDGLVVQKKVRWI